MSIAIPLEKALILPTYLLSTSLPTTIPAIMAQPDGVSKAGSILETSSMIMQLPASNLARIYLSKVMLPHLSVESVRFDRVL